MLDFDILLLWTYYKSPFNCESRFSFIYIIWDKSARVKVVKNHAIQIMHRFCGLKTMGPNKVQNNVMVWLDFFPVKHFDISLNLHFIRNNLWKTRQKKAFPSFNCFFEFCPASSLSKTHNGANFGALKGIKTCGLNNLNSIADLKILSSIISIL